MLTIILAVLIALLVVLALIFHGALIFGYERGGILGALRMLVALVFYEIMIIFFH